MESGHDTTKGNRMLGWTRDDYNTYKNYLPPIPNDKVMFVEVPQDGLDDDEEKNMELENFDINDNFINPL